MILALVAILALILMVVNRTRMVVNPTRMAAILALILMILALTAILALILMVVNRTLMVAILTVTVLTLMMVIPPDHGDFPDEEFFDDCDDPNHIDDGVDDFGMVDDDHVDDPVDGDDPINDDDHVEDDCFDEFDDDHDFPDGINDVDPDAFFNDATLDDFNNLDEDNLRDFDPEAVGGFTSKHFENLDPDAVDGSTEDHFANFDPMAVDGFTADQIGNFDPEAVGGFTEEHFANFDPEAFAGFTDEHIDDFDPSVIDDIPPEGFGNLSHDAIESFTPEQFMELSPDQLGAMDSDNIGGFSPEIIQNMGDEVLDFFDPEQFRELPDEDFSKMMTNFDAGEFSPEELEDFIPDDWELDIDTGKLTAPPGAELNFKQADDSGLADGVDLPDLPDLNTGLAIGGEDPDGTVIDGLDNVMDDAGFGLLDFSQENGILQLGDYDSIGLEAAFIPDSDGIKQADSDAKPGISQDFTGKYILTTDEGYQIPLIPTLKDPEDIIANEPGATIVVGDKGEIRIQLAGENPIVGIAKLAVKTADPDLEPGVNQTGEGEDKEVIIVYSDGTAQKLKPAIQSPDEFVEALNVVDGMEFIEFNTNGTIDVNFFGEDLIIRPLFDVEPGESDTKVEPSITEEEERFFFTNSDGDTQEFLLGT